MRSRTVTNEQRDQIFLEVLPTSAGAFCILWGLQMIYAPACWIAAGIGLIWFARRRP